MPTKKPTFPRPAEHATTRTRQAVGMVFLLVLVGPAAAWLPTAAATYSSEVVVDPWWDGRMEVLGAHVMVDIRDGVALTQLSLKLHNAADRGDTAYLDAPLPWQSIPTRIALTGTNFTLEGDVKEAAEAQQTYEHAEQADVDAVLVQRADNRLRLSVHLPAGVERTLIIAYAEVLDQELGAWRYQLPTTSLGGAFQTSVPLTVQVTGQSSQAPSEILFPGWQPESIQQNNKSWSASFYSNTLPASDDLAISWMTPSSGPWRATLVRSGDRLDGTSGPEPLLLSVRPNDLTTGTALPRDIVFVLDTSGSMRGDKIDDAKLALDEILLDLRPDDRYAIVTFSSVATAWSESVHDPEGAELRDDRARLAAVQAGGSTNLDAALQQALTILRDSNVEHAPMIVLVSDGLPSSGITDHDLILSRARESNTVNAAIHVLAIGIDADDNLLENLAGTSGGKAMSVAADSDVRAAMRGFYESLENPVATDVRIFVSATTADGPLPARIPAIYSGSVEPVWLRVDPDEDARFTVRIEGVGASGATNASFVFDLANAQALPELASLWANRQIDAWQSASLSESERRNHILPLALRYDIVTPYTSWVITALAETESLAGSYRSYSPTTPTSGEGGMYSYDEAADHYNPTTPTTPGATASDSQPTLPPGESTNEDVAVPGPGFALVLVALGGLLVWSQVRRRP